MVALSLASVVTVAALVCRCRSASRSSERAAATSRRAAALADHRRWFLVMAAYAVIGVAVGALVRNQIIAMVGVLVWMLVVEQIVIPAYPASADGCPEAPPTLGCSSVPPSVSPAACYLPPQVGAYYLPIPPRQLPSPACSPLAETCCSEDPSHGGTASGRSPHCLSVPGGSRAHLWPRPMSRTSRPSLWSDDWYPHRIEPALAPSKK